ncbi:hypothetical protein QE152_g26745 [Popillia japonica]|uniref:Uncharacterized protein n=1 Tax=Popillia japonica TaxID=7064 RepID=A0AAW1JXB8_POPJA
MRLTQEELSAHSDGLAGANAGGDARMKTDGVDIRDDIVVIDNDDEQIDEKGYKTASGRIVRKPDRLYYNNSAAD